MDTRDIDKAARQWCRDHGIETTEQARKAIDKLLGSKRKDGAASVPDLAPDTVPVDPWADDDFEIPL